MRDLREAFRSLSSTPGPTLVILATLALAIGANTAIFSVVNGVLLRPMGYEAEDELVVVWESNRQQSIPKGRTSLGTYYDWRRQAGAFDGDLAIYQYVGFTLTGRDRPERLGSIRVSPRIFELLGVAPALGAGFTEADEIPGSEYRIVMTHAAWQRRFGGDPSVIGATIELDSEPYVVVGVMPEGFAFPPADTAVEMYSPLTFAESDGLDRPHRMYDTIGRLGAGVSREQAQEEMDAIAAQIAADYPQSNDGWGVSLVPVRNELIGEMGTTLWVLMGAVFAVLLIACANIANLLVARSAEVARDFMIRAALGAGRWALVRRSLADSVVLAAIGGGAGVLLAIWGVSFLRSVLPASLPRSEAIGMDVPVLAFALGLSGFAALACGLVPAFRVMTPNLSDALKGGGQSMLAARARWLTTSMVVAEVALALVLMVSAGLLVRSFSALNEVDPGFDAEGVVSFTVQLPESRYGFGNNLEFFNRLTERVVSLPGIDRVGAVSDLPMSEVGLAFEMPFTVMGLDAISPTERPQADFRAVIPEYLKTLGIPLVRGRYFDIFDQQQQREVAIVNEALVARYFVDVDPIGQRLQMPMAGELEIVGVVGNTRHGGLQSEVGPELYVPYAQLAVSDMHLVVKSDLDTATVARRVGDAILAEDPELVPSEVGALSDALWESVAQPRFNTALLAGLALCAALLAGVGIYGVVNYSVVQRTGEIGVRMALGADAGATALLVLRRAMGMVLIGAVLGIGMALATTRWLGGMLHGVEPTDLPTYLVVTSVALVAGMLAALLPARRATRVDPVVALRDD